MVRDRLSLHSLLVSILGTSKVYFQPPATLKMDYPCIIYQVVKLEAIHANDKRYLNMKRYLITVVDKNPDTITPNKILELRYCSFDNHFITDNLNHYNCSLYY
jgi:hypothetical protein